MVNGDLTSMSDPHCDAAPSAWVARFASLVPRGGTVLDLAAGAGRHSRLFLERGYRIVAADRETAALAGLPAQDRLEIITADLEGGRPWPLPGRRFSRLAGTDLPHRPFLPVIVGR